VHVHVHVDVGAAAFRPRPVIVVLVLEPVVKELDRSKGENAALTFPLTLPYADIDADVEMEVEEAVKASELRGVALRRIMAMAEQMVREILRAALGFRTVIWVLTTSTSTFTSTSTSTSTCSALINCNDCCFLLFVADTIFCILLMNLVKLCFKLRFKLLYVTSGCVVMMNGIGIMDGFHSIRSDPIRSDLTFFVSLNLT